MQLLSRVNLYLLRIVRDNFRHSPILRDPPGNADSLLISRSELARVPDFSFEIGSKIDVIDPFDPKLHAVA